MLRKTWGRSLPFCILPGNRPTGLWMNSVTVSLDEAAKRMEDRSPVTYVHAQPAKTQFPFCTHPVRSLVTGRGLPSTCAGPPSAALGTRACRTPASVPNRCRPVARNPATYLLGGCSRKRLTHLVLVLNFKQSLATSQLLHYLLSLLQE